VTDVTKRCKDCDTEYTLTAEQIARFVAKGLTVPFRCERCRQAAQFWRDVKSRRATEDTQ
jgi:hypothetical protein